MKNIPKVRQPKEIILDWLNTTNKIENYQWKLVDLAVEGYEAYSLLNPKLTVSTFARQFKKDLNISISQATIMRYVKMGRKFSSPSSRRIPVTFGVYAALNSIKNHNYWLNYAWERRLSVHALLDHIRMTSVTTARYISTYDNMPTDIVGVKITPILGSGKKPHWAMTATSKKELRNIVNCLLGELKG